MDVTPNINLNVMFNGYAYTDFDTQGFYEGSDADFGIGTASSTTVGVEVRF